jgi:hypothetical protein
MAHLQIRNVPPDIHRKLKARAARAGMSLNEYLLKEVGTLAELPTVDEWLERVARRKPTRAKESSAEVIRRHRDAS